MELAVHRLRWERVVGERRRATPRRRGSGFPTGRGAAAVAADGAQHRRSGGRGALGSSLWARRRRRPRQRGRSRRRRSPQRRGRAQRRPASRRRRQRVRWGRARGVAFQGWERAAGGVCEQCLYRDGRTRPSGAAEQCSAGRGQPGRGEKLESSFSTRHCPRPFSARGRHCRRGPTQATEQ